MRMHHNRRGASNYRGGGRPYQNSFGRGIFETSGPAGKFRGTAQQLTDRYVNLGKDFLSKREYIRAQECFQHAEHYRRLAAQSAGEKSVEKKEDSARPVYQKSSVEKELSPEKNDAAFDAAHPSPASDLPSFIVDDGEESLVEKNEKPNKVRSTRKQSVKKSSIAGEKEPIKEKVLSEEGESDQKPVSEKSVVRVKRRRRVKAEKDSDTEV